MEIKIAEEAGFCFGVKRAVDLTRNAVKKYGKPVFTYGELIHNKYFLKKLENEGIFIKNKIEEINKDDVIVIRAHGIPPIEEKKIKEIAKIVIDGTCPLVKNVHRNIKKILESNMTPVIIGKKGHPEVIAEMGYAEGKGILISSLDEAQTIDFSRLEIGIVSQTTFPPDKVKKIVNYIRLNSKKIKIYDTICSATLMRQSSSIKLAEEVEVIFVVGGKNSSNTRTLYEMIKKINNNTFYIESYEEIKDFNFNKYTRIGITGGASTPQEMMLEIKEKILEAYKNSPRRQRENGRSEKC